MIIHDVYADTVTNTISVGAYPTTTAVNPSTNMIYVANTQSGTISVIDGATNIVVSTINLPAIPYGVTVNPTSNMVYVAENTAWQPYPKATIQVINGSTNQIVASITPQLYPYDLKVNPITNKIYVLENSGYQMNGPTGAIQVINGTTNTIATTINTQSLPDHGIALDSVTNKIYVYNMVIDGSTDTVTSQIPGLCSYGLAVNPSTNRLYSTCSGSVQVVDLSTNAIITTVSAGAFGIDVNSATNKIYVTDPGNWNNYTSVAIIDGSTNTVMQQITVGSGPSGVAINQNTNKIYVTNQGGNTISVIDGSSSSTSTVPTAPQNLQSTAGNSQVTLSWTTPSSDGGSTITGYNVYRGTTSGGEISTPVAASITSTSYSDTTAANGQTYFYKVTAVNSVGESASSNEASATPTAPATVSSAPTGLTASTLSSSQINLSWTAPTNNGGSTITGYDIERSTDNGSTWSTVQSNTGSTATTYSDTGLAASTTYTYRVSTINSVGTSQPSNTASATTSAVTPPPPPAGITLNNVQSTSGTVSSSNQMTLANFNAGTGNNRLLVVGISANNNNAISVTFGGVSMTQAAGSFYNNDVEFWYLKNPTGTGNVVVTTGGSTQAVVGAYSFAGVNQTIPIPTHVTKHNTTPNSPNITITTKFANDWVLDLSSIYGGSSLGSPTCAQQWDANVPDAITGASSSKMVQTPSAVTCKWIASSGDFWDDAAIEIKASK